MATIGISKGKTILEGIQGLREKTKCHVIKSGGDFQRGTRATRCQKMGGHVNTQEKSAPHNPLKKSNS